MERLILKGGTLVLPDGLVQGDVIVRSGLIEGVLTAGHDRANVPEGQLLDVGGSYILPGMIDMHSDAIEREIEPRPGAMFPLEMAVHELEKKLAACGITRMYHSVSLADGVGVRSDERVLEIIRGLRAAAASGSMIRHCVHLRYEITNSKGAEAVMQLIRGGEIDLLSYMDHTPGQGQFKDEGKYANYVMKTFGLDLQQAAESVDLLRRNRMHIDLNVLRSLSEAAGEAGIAIASHDDDEPRKIAEMLALNASISEFPVNLEAARYARTSGMHVCVGSPNVIRGESHSNNMRAIDAIREGSADILCSDYVPSSMLPAVFQIAEAGVPLHEAVKMTTLNPAKALGLDTRFGSIEAGKAADLLVVELRRGYPIVRRTLVGGEPVYQSAFLTSSHDTAPAKPEAALLNEVRTC